MAREGGVGSRKSAADVRASLYSAIFASLVGGVTLGGMLEVALEPREILDGCFICSVNMKIITERTEN